MLNRLYCLMIVAGNLVCALFYRKDEARMAVCATCAGQQGASRRRNLSSPHGGQSSLLSQLAILRVAGMHFSREPRLKMLAIARRLGVPMLLK